MINFVRIDNRLLHGQVTVAWLGTLHVDFILIADDSAANDPIKSMALKIGKPSSVGMEIRSVDDAIQKIEFGRYKRKKVLLITGSVSQALRLVKGLSGENKITSVNFGSVPQITEDSTKFDDAIYLNNQEIQDSIEMMLLGVDCYSQMIPTKPKKSLQVFMK